MRIYFLFTQQAKLSLHYLIFTEQLQDDQVSLFTRYLATFATKGNWLVVCSNSYGAVLCQNCRNSKWPKSIFWPTLQAIIMTYGFWSNGTFIDQFILIFISDHDLSSITLKTLSQCTLKANHISEQTKAIGEMEKKTQVKATWPFLFEYGFCRKSSFIYLLLFKLISLVQKVLNTEPYFN